MKKKLIALAVAGAMTTLILQGCDSGPSDIEKDRAFMADLDREVVKDTSAKLNQEKKELDELIRELQKEDPNVVDAYYSQEQEGRALNVVREDENGNATSNMLMGAIAGYALASAMNNRGHSSYYNSHNARQSPPITREEQRKKKNRAYAGYVSAAQASAKNNIRKNPSRLNTIKQGALSRVASARSSGYSSGS